MTTPAPPSPRAALITGGTRRIGSWASEALLEDGWRVQAVYRSDEAAAGAFYAQMQRRFGPEARGLSLFSADMADESAALAAAQNCAAVQGGIDLLVCAAGPALTAALSATSAAEMEGLWRGNVLAAHNAVRACLPWLSQSAGGGRVILFSVAGAGQRAFREIPAYSACKAMLESVARSLARELAPEGISVNCIALGITSLPPDGAPLYPAERLPTGRAVEQRDLAALLRYLAGPESGQLSGAVLPLSGGFGL